MRKKVPFFVYRGILVCWIQIHQAPEYPSTGSYPKKAKIDKNLKFLHIKSSNIPYMAYGITIFSSFVLFHMLTPISSGYRSSECCKLPNLGENGPKMLENWNFILNCSKIPHMTDRSIKVCRKMYFYVLNPNTLPYGASKHCVLP